MPKYRCNNSECSLFNEDMFLGLTQLIIRNGEAVDRNQLCPNCGSKRDTIREPGMTTAISGTNDQKLRGLPTIK